MRSREVRSRDVRTKWAMARCLMGRWPSRILLLAAAGAVTARMVLAAVGHGAVPGLGLGAVPGFGGGVGFGTRDLVVVLVGLVAVGPLEWLIHRHLFHAPTTSWRWRRLGTGHRHRLHHDDPDRLDWLLLDGRGVVVLLVATAAIVTLWAVPIGLARPGLGAGPSLGPTYLTGLAVAWSALANYEWTHLLAHVGYRPRTGRARRLVRHHLAHHHRDSARWFGITTTLGDRLFGTAR